MFPEEKKSPTARHRVYAQGNDGRWKNGAPRHIYTSARKGCLMHSSAVARLSGSKASMGTSQPANSLATASSHSYLSVRTSYSGHGFNLVMFRSSPFFLNKPLIYSGHFYYLKKSGTQIPESAQEV